MQINSKLYVHAYIIFTLDFTKFHKKKNALVNQITEDSFSLREWVNFPQGIRLALFIMAISKQLSDTHFRL